jgi:hypothetical protein
MSHEALQPLTSPELTTERSPPPEGAGFLTESNPQLQGGNLRLPCP